MPLNYTPYGKRSAKRIGTWVVSVFILILAIAILGGWVFLFYRQSLPSAPDDDTDPTVQYEDPLTEVNCSLVIFDFDENRRFVLIQTAPADNAIRILDVPSHLTDANGDTLTAIFSKRGALQAMQTVATALELSIDHYITWTAAGARSFLEELDRGVTYTLPESMQYTDKNGSTIRLSAGEQQLTGAQMAAVLQNDTWSNIDIQKQTTTNVIAAILNQYIVPQQSLDGYFSALADTAQTDLRIDHYNAFRRTLSHLGDNNTGALCQIITLIGTEQNGQFLPDVSAMQTQTDLYRE